MLVATVTVFLLCVFWFMNFVSSTLSVPHVLCHFHRNPSLFFHECESEAFTKMCLFKKKLHNLKCLVLSTTEIASWNA